MRESTRAGNEPTVFINVDRMLIFYD